jgi:cyanophycinase
MIKSILYIIVTIIFLLSSAAMQGFAQGNLVIVGGGLESDNKEIFSELIQLSGGKEKMVVSVIPAASGVAMQTFVSFSNALKSFGVLPENIHLIPIAMVDDDSTTNEDESLWSINGNDLLLAEKIRKSNCIWFSGGDQLRIVKTLMREDGSNTPVLDAVWEVYQSGGLIGGTSAGAAIMSDPMIGSGSSMGALLHGSETSKAGEDIPDFEGLLMTKGLGFFPHGIVDQHFHARSRIGRLIIAMMQNDNQKQAFGVDENTALIYLGKQKMFKVAGEAGVTIIDASEAVFLKESKYPQIENLSLSYLENGDSYNISTRQVTVSDEKKLIAGNEYYQRSNPYPSGMFLENKGGFMQLLTKSLIENNGQTSIQNLNFFNLKQAFQVSLRKTEKSRGYRAEGNDGNDRYTILNVSMDLRTVDVSVKTLK